MTEDYQTFGQFVKAHRLIQGITQGDIAFHCETWRAKVADIENDVCTPNSKLMMQILSYLKSQGAPDFDFNRISPATK